jgi:glycine cleavage system H lipoate-binding protein
VTEVNGNLAHDPELVYREPFGDGWLFRMEVGADAEAILPSKLLSLAEYQELLKRVRETNQE